MQQELIARGEISKFVESFWESQAKDRFFLPPDGTGNILYSAHPFIISDLQGNQYRLSAGIYLLPIYDRSISIIHTQSIIGIRLKAFSLHNITCQSSIFSITTTHFSQLNPNLNILYHYFNKLHPKEGLLEAVPILEELALEILNKKKGLNQHLREQVNYILERNQALKISEMGKDLCISRQALHKGFINHLGISPKQLAGIWRFNQYLLATQNENSLTQSALEAGYYDQAHGINDFKKYVPIAPGKLSYLETNLSFTIQCIRNRFSNRYDPSL